MKRELNILIGTLCLLVARSFQAQTIAETIPEANPGRPTVSTPATLTPVGYLQFENGLLYAEHSPEFSTRTGLNQVTKLAVFSRLQALLLIEPLVHSRAGGSNTENHVGEVFLGVQGVLLPGERRRPTVSVSYMYRLHASPAPEIDIGTFRQSAIVLVSDDLLGFHFDLNGIATEQEDSGLRRAQFGQTLSVSHPLGRFTVSGEIWHFSQPLTGGNAVGNLWAASYPVRKNLVVDVGFDHGLTSTSTQWETFGGVTYLLPHRLWRERR
ncbi:MAG: hypothetical protein JWQ49_5425 [Edaphobacter sp.]|nr:hypothetical protein [Edaphobacter sp.]